MIRSVHRFVLGDFTSWFGLGIFHLNALWFSDMCVEMIVNGTSRALPALGNELPPFNPVNTIFSWGFCLLLELYKVKPPSFFFPLGILLFQSSA
jgi:hypothetical protein